MKRSTHYSVAVGLFMSSVMALSFSFSIALLLFTMFLMWMTFDNPNMSA